MKSRKLRYEEKEHMFDTAVLFDVTPKGPTIMVPMARPEYYGWMGGIDQRATGEKILRQIKKLIDSGEIDVKPIMIKEKV